MLRIRNLQLVNGIIANRLNCFIVLIMLALEFAYYCAHSVIRHLLDWKRCRALVLQQLSVGAYVPDVHHATRPGYFGTVRKEFVTRLLSIDVNEEQLPHIVLMSH